MKKIAVIAREKEYTMYLKQHLDIYFSKYATIKSYSLDEVKRLGSIDEKFIVVSSYGVLQQIKENIDSSVEFLIPGISLNRDKFAEIKRIAPKSKVLIVDISYRYSSQFIAMLYSAGFKNLNFQPYYPGIDSYDCSVEIAITPNYKELVPESIKRIIDIGNNFIDLDDIYIIAEKIGIEKIFGSIVPEEMKNKIFIPECNLERLMGKKDDFLRNLGYVINETDNGIMITDITGKIFLYNDKCARLLRKHINLRTGFNVLEIFPRLSILKPLLKEEIERKSVEILGGFNFELKLNPLIKDGEITGNVITVKLLGAEASYMDLKKGRHLSTGHVSRYSFEDIIGECDVLRNAVNTAKKFAHLHSSVLITGESGTGKELFAQSMHGLSPRRNNNFVAINCSAIPENLLESELFGYDEGAFSGAQRGGKAGLFEIADRGTVFLDEIGDMPLVLQAKLLRTLEEGTIIRVGGKDVIQIDIRVISATNKNLHSMIKKGEFRQDLYYRLNVLRLYVPPLRERKKDILLLHDYFMSQLECSYSLDGTAKDSLLNYRWPGNIRELRNIVEQLSTLGKPWIEADDIPFESDMSAWPTEEDRPDGIYLERMCNRFLLNEGKKIELFRFTLQELALSSEQDDYTGRNKLIKKAKETGIKVSEEEIKVAMHKLSSAGFIVSYPGRRGSEITDQGKFLLNLIHRIKL